MQPWPITQQRPRRLSTARVLLIVPAVGFATTVAAVGSEAHPTRSATDARVAQGAVEANAAGRRGTARPAPAATRLGGPGPLAGGRYLGIGSRAGAVRSLQRRLTRAGFRTAADGVFGARTAAAVARFQRARGLVVDGVVGRQTMAALGTRRASRPMAGQPRLDPAACAPGDRRARCARGPGMARLEARRDGRGPRAGAAGSSRAVAAGRQDASTAYRSVRALGPARQATDGLMRVKLKDATTVLTHGLDPKLPAATKGVARLGGPERQPVCATDHYQHVLYGHPADKPNRISSVRQTILTEIKVMNAILNTDALLSGGTTADYKVKCDGAGEIAVDVFESPQSNAQTTFAGVVSAARAAGFDRRNADYTIFFDSSAPPACGTGTYSDDQRLSADNHNNSGGDYGVTYSDCWTDLTPMHENGHNQGAVQYDAPHSTGNGGHCGDGNDVMCYSDGGDKDLGLTVLCARTVRFDCRDDTYFDAKPEPDEYLATHWNLGSPLNRFIAFGAAAPQTPACEDGLDNEGDGKRDHPADPGCSSPDDGDEADPRSPNAAPAPPPRAPPPVEPRRLPTLTVSAARRHARLRIRRARPRAAAISVRCVRRTRTTAACAARWKEARAREYSGRLTVGYRSRGGREVLIASLRARRIR